MTTWYILYIYTWYNMVRILYLHVVQPDMQNFTLFTKAYFDTKNSFPGKHEKFIVNTSFIYNVLYTHCLPLTLTQYVLQIYSLPSHFTIIYPQSTIFTRGTIFYAF